MNDQDFDALRANIDAQIDAYVGPAPGITMAFNVAGAFWARGLLETIDYEVIGTRWEMRTYRNWIVYPDPSLDDGEFVFGRMMA